MALLEIGTDWKFVLVVFIVTLYIAIISFDMLSHWNTKKREDLRLLIVGVGLFAVVILGLTSPTVPSFIVNFLFVIILVLSGLLLAKDDFDTSEKPVELYFIAYGSLVILATSIVWWYYYTKTGKYARAKGKELRDFTRRKGDQFSEWREKRRKERDMRAIQRGKALQERMMEREKKMTQAENPMFTKYYE